MNKNETILVADVMSPSVKTVSGMATVADAVGMMRDAGVSSLVVERRDDTDEFGLLVVSDIASEVIAKNRALERVNVYEVMTKPVLTVAKEMQIKYATRLLVSFSLSRALVVDADRKPCGIITLRDMVLRHA